MSPRATMSGTFVCAWSSRLRVRGPPPKRNSSGKPLVTSTPTFAPRSWVIALVTTVVALTSNWVEPSRSSSDIPSSSAATSIAPSTPRLKSS
jgi:hypothetical protein